MANVIKNLTSRLPEQPRLEIVTVTPDFAKELLQQNTGNFRRADMKRINSYANDMAAGHWEMTGDTIKITNGRLIDGQHRLMACVKSGAPFRTAIAYDVAESAQYVDRGKPRTVSQWLRHLNMKESSLVAASSKLVLMHDKGLWANTMMQIDEFSDAEVVDYAKSHYESLYHAIKLAAKSRQIMSQAIGAAIIHIGAGRRPPDEDELSTWFWNGVANGHGMEDTDPPLALRNRLLSAKLNSNMKMSPAYQRWLCTIAWNKAVTGDRLTPTGLRVRSVGPAKQQAPAVVLTSSDIYQG